MTNPIVTVNVSLQQAPIPNLLQKTGALISQGGTLLAAGEYSLLTQPSDLDALLAAALDLTSCVWSSGFGGQVTATAAAPHGIPVGQQFVTEIADVVPSGYNGTVLATATTTTAFTYKLAADPGAQTVAGTYTPPTVGELQAMVDTFFAQGLQQGVYVLELGSVEVDEAVAELADFIAGTDQFFYSYVTPRAWDGNSDFLEFLAGFEATTSKTYFFVTTTLQNYALYEDMKCVDAMIENPVYGTWDTATIDDLAWADGVATATTVAPHGIYPGDYFKLIGVDPAEWNGRFRALPGTTGSTLKYQLATEPDAYDSGGSVVKSLYASTGIPAVEFSHASDYQKTLNYDPGSVNKVTPLAFSILSGVTEFSQKGNKALLAELKAANVNYVGNGGEGGISNKILYWGRTMDGRPFNYWYSIDWVQIQSQIAIANAVINGSNNPINPLYLNQDGIDRLQQAIVEVGNSAVSFGLALGSVIPVSLTAAQFQDNLNRGIYAGNIAINAVPFASYYSLAPSDYRTGKYAGFSMVYTPLRGFEHIVFNIVATDFVAAQAA